MRQRCASGFRGCRSRRWREYRIPAGDARDDAMKHCRSARLTPATVSLISFRADWRLDIYITFSLPRYFAHSRHYRLLMPLSRSITRNLLRFINKMISTLSRWQDDSPKHREHDYRYFIYRCLSIFVMTFLKPVLAAKRTRTPAERAIFRRRDGFIASFSFTMMHFHLTASKCVRRIGERASATRSPMLNRIRVQHTYEFYILRRWREAAFTM